VLTDGLATGRFQVSGWLVAEDRDTPYDGSTETPNPLHERTRIRVVLLTSDLRLGARSGVQISATVPDITRSAVVASAGGTLQPASETFRGWGDTSVVGWYRVPASVGWNLTINGGLSLPTGKTERPRFRASLDEGSLVPLSRLQRGSGTLDPLVGVSANRLITRLFPPGVRVFTSAAARMPVSENEYGLRTGASWEVSGGASREVWRHWLVPLGRISWLHREQDEFDGVPVLVGGGHWISLSPGVAVQIGKFTIQTEFRLPLYRDLANRQLDSALTVQFGVIRTF
jgi:hypothetical protein